MSDAASMGDEKKIGFFGVAMAWIGRQSIQLLLCLIVVLLVLGNFVISTGSSRWEYKSLREFQDTPRDRNGSDAFKASMVNPSQDKIDALGKEGWELVTCYLEPETAWPNFGKDEYVTGLQPNVRAQSLVMIFKRKL